ncbi:MAG: hypothetical protein ABJB05_03290 [Parafilimonas sp.]
MKKFLLIILTGFSLVSCTKKVSTPTGAANQNIFFKDANVAVENIVAVPTKSSNVTINFSTAFENNISRIELMSSSSTNTFCTTESVDIAGNSSSKKNYSFSDSNVKSSTMYYMLRFKDNTGNWTYSPYLTVQVN